MRERKGIAARVLKAQGVSEDRVRMAIAAAGVPTSDEVPDRVPFAPRAKKAIQLAVREALQLGHNYVGTEHLLLGLLSEGEGVGADVLRELGVGEDAVRESIKDVLRDAA
jgi:ATP-dependent Clp protease ATP-binding subunit ClpA